MTTTTTRPEPVTGPAGRLVAVLIDDSDLATAGLRALLAPFEHRLTLVDPRTALAHPGDLDVILYEPVGLTPVGASMLRDLQRLSEAQTAVFSWVEADQLPTADVQPHLGKRLAAAQVVRAVEDLVVGRYQAAVTSANPSTGEAEVEVPGEDESASAHPHPHPHPVESPLTPRESDVVALITNGWSNLEISEDLEVSINSIKTYIRSAYRKMGVTRRSQAVLWGVTNGYDRSDPSTSGSS